jgi:dipeptidyl aminopeptidase/acylaminoacyl peptidase
MAKQTILYLHGFASSAQSTKARYFRAKFKELQDVEYHAVDCNPTPEDFEHLTTTGLINRLRQYVLDHRLADIQIIGSSYGGLIALHYAHRFGGVRKMLLLAPGVFWLSGGLSEEELTKWEKARALPVHHPAFQKEIAVRYDLQLDGLRYLEPVPPAAPVLIIHGCADETVPLAHSRTFAADYPDQVSLIEVQADHDLNDCLELIWEYAQSFLLENKVGGEQRAG